MHPAGADLERAEGVADGDAASEEHHAREEGEQRDLARGAVPEEAFYGIVHGDTVRVARAGGGKDRRGVNR